ncbi:MAG: hypothetical protein ABIU05_11860 [Nitrospirales bacterium]
MMKVLLLIAITTLSGLLVVTSTVAGEFRPCCKDGSSPYASESKDTFKSNARAGYRGGELPPSTGYNPDHLYKYSHPQNSIYNRERNFPYGATEERPVPTYRRRPLAGALQQPQDEK